MKRPMRMSRALRGELEEIARMCNDYKPHEAGDRLEAILGYEVGDCVNPKYHSQDDKDARGD